MGVLDPSEFGFRSYGNFAIVHEDCLTRRVSAGSTSRSGGTTFSNSSTWVSWSQQRHGFPCYPNVDLGLGTVWLEASASASTRTHLP